MNVVALIFRSEVRQLVRDRRALFSAVLLPALLYPLIFWSQTELEESSREILAAREVGVAVDFSRADSDVATRARDLLAQRTPIQIYEADAEAIYTFDAEDAPALDQEVAGARRRKLVEDVLANGGHVLVTAEVHSTVERRTQFTIYFHVKDDEAREAADRAEAALGELDYAMTLARRRELIGDDPAAGLDVAAVDVATAADSSGARLGRILPLLAVLVLLSGGSYAALAVFAGEREAGTLETLLVQPVPATQVVGGKFAAVLAAGLVTLFANLASILACVQLGLAGDLGSVAGGGLHVGRLLSGVIYLPGCVLMCAILCLVCGRARTFRQGQQTILPVMLLTALPTAVVLQPSIENTLLMAVIPFTGPALALRDALSGNLAWLSASVMVASHALWTWLILGRLSHILDAERVLSTSDTESESAQRHIFSRHAKTWGFVSVLAVYIVGGKLQQWNLQAGLAMTFWILLPLLAFACSKRIARRAREPWYRDLRLRAPSPAHVVAAVLLAPGLAWLMTVYIGPLVLWLLPLPTSQIDLGQLQTAFDTLSSGTLFFLFALSPGIWEEVLFRGALLSNLQRDLPASRAIVWQALFFAVTHASIHRLLPTFVMGLVFGAITVRAKSLWPAIALHVAYDALLILGGAGRLPFTASDAWVYAPLASLVGVALLARRSRSRE